MSTTLNNAVQVRTGEYHPTHGVIHKNFTWRDSTAALGTEQVIGVLPANAVVTSGVVWVRTLFNGTTPTISIGLAGSPALYLAATATTAVGGTNLAALLIAAAAVPSATARNIVAVVAAGATAPTAGSVDVHIEFSP